MAARAARRANHWIARRPRMLVALGAAAAIVLVVAGLMSRRGVVETPVAHVQDSTRSDVEQQQHPLAARPGDDGNRVETVANGDFPAARRRDSLVTLAVDPVQESEQLALVHIRVTQDALLSLGIAMNESGASGLVDVEVLVGGDGLPRDIRSMRTVLTGEERDPRD